MGSGVTRAAHMTGMSHFVEEYLHIVSDPAHLAAELTFMVVIDLVVLGIFFPLLKAAASRVARRSVAAVVEQRVLAEHAAIDAEHGVEPHALGEVDRTA